MKVKLPKQREQGNKVSREQAKALHQVIDL